MIHGTAEIVGKTDDIMVRVTLVLSIAECRSFLKETEDVRAWPVSEFRNVVRDVVQKTVDRVERAQEVSS